MTAADWLPLAKAKPAEAVPTGEAFRSEWIDFQRGIRVGNLEPHERITRILKHRLEERHGTPFVTDRWGRGVYWQWICWLPRANREAKPVSHSVNFGCAKLFISVDRTDRIFQSGLQVERGVVSGGEGASFQLAKDWDWHRLMKACTKAGALEKELRRLILREGFIARIEGGGREASFAKGSFSSALQIRKAARAFPLDSWAGFQLFYPMPMSEVRTGGGYELVQAIMGVFGEVLDAMNLCMQVDLKRDKALPRLG
jgi:hypothetical protein